MTTTTNRITASAATTLAAPTRITFPVTITASESERTISGMLLPFDTPGATSAGLITVEAASAPTLPDEPGRVIFNREHDRLAPLGRASSLSVTDAGIIATFALADTTAGRDALTEARDGLRAGLSVEIDNADIIDGRLVGGHVTGAALVVRPAFPTAQVTAKESDTTTMPCEICQTVHAAGAPACAPVTAAATNAADGTTTTATAAATAATGAAAAVAPGSTPGRVTAGAKTTVATLMARLVDAHMSGQRVEAALADVIPSNILGIEQPQYVGELWSGKAYERKIIPQFNSGVLTSFKVAGWRWTTKPVVGDYAGNKAAIPSAAIATEAVTINAQRLAGGHDIDRKFIDFADTEFFAAYYKAMTESYAKTSDARVLTAVTTAATDVTAEALPTPSAGLAPGWGYVVDGALSIMENTDSLATSATVSLDLWREMILATKDNVLAYLSAALGLEEGSLAGFKIIPSRNMATDTALVAARDAVTVHELGGPAPIRVEALDVSKGGVDSGVFGYYAVNVHDAGGLALVTGDEG